MWHHGPQRAALSGERTTMSDKARLIQAGVEGKGLRGQSRILRDILEYIADPIFVKDRSHRWVIINRAFAALVGHPAAALLGKSDHDFFPREQADFFHAKDNEVFRSGTSVTIDEEPMLDALGRVHILRTTKVPVLTAGRVTHIVGIIHDITHLKGVEEELRHANELLEQRVEERTREVQMARDALLREERLSVLGRLSGGVAHQIRNPLAAIRNAAAVLRHRLGREGDPAVTQALSIIDEEVTEANRIISDLLDYASIRPPRLADVEVSDLVEGALARASAPSGIAIRRELVDGLRARIDGRQTRDALANVIRNGIDAVEGGAEGGTAPGQQGVLTLRTAAEGELVTLTVEDNGPGVAEAAVPLLFEPLVTTKSLGLGLGLATAKALIENQRGTIAYQPSSAGGACFVIRLPRAPTE